MSTPLSDGGKPFLHIGKRVGRWTIQFAIEGSDPRKWSCQCDCGERRSVRHDHLISGQSQGCGCARAAMHSKVIGVALQPTRRDQRAPSLQGTPR